LKLILALVGGSIGLLVTASAVFLAWAMYQYLKHKKEAGTGPSLQSVQANTISSVLLRWTFFDYALIAVFAIGSLFLFTDVIAVIRDSESYPLYHYGYLLCGFIFTLFGMLFMVLRLLLVLRLIRTDGAAALPDNHDQPSGADQAEQRIERG
jgi:hypothetical protein